MHNKDYTCDICGEQMYAGNTYALYLSPLISDRSTHFYGMRKDLCSRCAGDLRARIEQELLFLQQLAKENKKLFQPEENNEKIQETPNP